MQAPISIELEWSRRYRAYHCARRGWGGVEPRTAREPVKNDVEGNVLHEGLVGDGDVVALERPAPGSQRPAGRVPPAVDCGSRLSVLMNLSSVWMSGGYDETRVRRWSFFFDMHSTRTRGRMGEGSPQFLRALSPPESPPPSQTDHWDGGEDQRLPAAAPSLPWAPCPSLQGPEFTIGMTAKRVLPQEGRRGGGIGRGCCGP